MSLLWWMWVDLTSSSRSPSRVLLDTKALSEVRALRLIEVGWILAGLAVLLAAILTFVFL